MPRGVGIPGGMITSSGRTKIDQCDPTSAHPTRGMRMISRLGLKRRNCTSAFFTASRPTTWTPAFISKRMADAPVPASFSRGSSKSL